ncbi:D-alanyl-D-alanine carboxypeptidase [Chamaesiphon polymorphus]|uniref:D-alanyl-D-alanine carboxypeptidase n=1 Tax=Chamaesiphon polymorphus CCALA 037 TaxID=2107692 RepID=A0A2T1GI13_9CYAN|nr:D-alanyl-D-alanine carboxypeptidase [Chamaesiphon polymorphus]PSB57358.1 D-alanyl-D-alanine carboxypeptidase [Chamaesiphon polymorphus CCALA 037]
MLQLVSSGLAGMWLNLAGVNMPPGYPAQAVSWQGLSWLDAPTPVEPKVEKTIEGYLQTLKAQGLDPKQQAVWLQTNGNLLIDRNGKIPVPSASLTKAATSLAVITTWGLDKKLDTIVSANGKISQGTLTGDLIVRGGGDPLFVWEDAIALAQSLNKLGIDRVSGNLIVVDKFHMNYKADPQKAGELLKQAFTGINLPPALLNTEFKDVNIVKLPTAPTATTTTKLPQVKIAGTVMVASEEPSVVTPLIRHRSLSPIEILRQMNIYSNNEIAQILADSVGGAEQVMKIVSTTAKFPPAEIQLINGSGLGVQNRLSPRAVCQIFRTLHQTLQPANLNLADIFPVAGAESVGTLKDRHLPVGTTMKTGTLNEVSALGGVLPTRDRGLVWFVIVNKGSQIAKLRQQQDTLLQSLLKEWGTVTPTPLVVTKHDREPAYFGDPARNIVLMPTPANSSVQNP